MRISTLLLTVFSLLFSLCATAQSSLNKYWIFFTEKEQGLYDPYTYFDIKAIERRLKSNVPINHKSDWPVQSGYIKSVREIATSTSHSSRWFNALSITATPDEITAIERLNCVKSIEPMMTNSYPASVTKPGRTITTVTSLIMR